MPSPFLRTLAGQHKFCFSCFSLHADRASASVFRGIFSNKIPNLGCSCKHQEYRGSCMTLKASSMSFGLAAIALFISCHTTVAGQQEKAGKKSDQEQTVRLKTDLVELRAVVTDKKGNLIDGLRKEDFEVLERGAPQEIGFFSLERIQSGSTPATPTAKAPLPRNGPPPATPAPPPARSSCLSIRCTFQHSASTELKRS